MEVDLDAIYPPKAPVSEDALIVNEIRINYVSGAFIQTWFKKFEFVVNEQNDFQSIEYEIAEVHESAQGQVTAPLHIGIDNIESIWSMSRMTAEELYNKSYTV